MSSNFLCDIGDGQNLSENLSTFSAHIANVLDILKRVNQDSLVVMDELGSGTDPAEGMGIAIAVLEELKKSGALLKSAFCTTAHGNTVYAKADGTLAVNTTFTVDGKKYFAKKSGAIAKNTFSKTAKGSKVYSNAKGELITNKLFKVDGIQYYAKKSGALAVKTWITVGGKKYYCSASGAITKTK